jgi:RNA polymerase sigma factor (TIGR02999 family)
MSDITHILAKIESGDRLTAEQRLPLVYDELRQLAAAKLAHEKPGQTLQATALVHEAYVRLVDQTVPQRWENQRHFFAAAVEAMRRILIDRARRLHRPKHGGGRRRVDLEAVIPASDAAPDTLLAMEEALTLCRWEHELDILRNVNPQSDTEHLLMAYALVLPFPPVAIELLKSEPRIFSSPVGLLIRCEANVLVSLDQKDLGIINQAVEDGEYQPGDLFNGTACLRYLIGEWSEDRLLKDAGNHGYPDNVSGGIPGRMEPEKQLFTRGYRHLVQFVVDAAPNVTQRDDFVVDASAALQNAVANSTAMWRGKCEGVLHIEQHAIGSSPGNNKAGRSHSALWVQQHFIWCTAEVIAT